MNEDNAREAVRRIVGTQGLLRLEGVAAAVLTENERQNLIARSTTGSLWLRHILDSVQLLQWQGDQAGPWLDIGTGGGFPGLAIAAVSDRPMILAEPRARRAAFLADTAKSLGFRHVSVVQRPVQTLQDTAPAIVSARAVATVSDLLVWTMPMATPDTRWLLQRGASWQTDRAALIAGWKGSFHVEQSLTNAEGRILVATGVSPK